MIFLKKKYNIDNPKSISRYSKIDRDRILVNLKNEFPVGQLQRIAEISKGVITKVE